MLDAQKLSAIYDNACFLYNPNFYYIWHYYTPLNTSEPVPSIQHYLIA